MLKKIYWNTFVRDFLVIQVGLGLFGVAIALTIRANLGATAWAVLDVALANIFGVTPGTVTVLMGFLVLAGALLLGEKIGWGTLVNLLSIGPWEDLGLWLIPPVNDQALLQWSMLVMGCAAIGLASAIYINVNAGAGPRDSLMLAIKRTTGVSLRVARSLIEAVVVALGWFLGGPAGWGTLAFALLIGPFVQWGFKLLSVEPHPGDV